MTLKRPNVICYRPPFYSPRFPSMPCSTGPRHPRELVPFRPACIYQHPPPAPSDPSTWRRPPGGTRRHGPSDPSCSSSSPDSLMRSYLRPSRRWRSSRGGTLGNAPHVSTRPDFPAIDTTAAVMLRDPPRSKPTTQEPVTLRDRPITPRPVRRGDDPFHVRGAR